MGELHVPVMLDEVIDQLNLTFGGIYIDCTFGAGGYSKKILSTKECKLFAIDQDPDVIQFAKQIKNDNFIFINQNFGNLSEIAQENKVNEAPPGLRGYFSRKGDYVMKLGVLISANHSGDQLIKEEDLL